MPLIWQHDPNDRFGGSIYVAVAASGTYVVVCGNDHVKTFYHATDRAGTCIGRSISIADAKAVALHHHQKES